MLRDILTASSKKLYTSVIFACIKLKKIRLVRWTLKVNGVRERRSIFELWTLNDKKYIWTRTERHFSFSPVHFCVHSSTLFYANVLFSLKKDLFIKKSQNSIFSDLKKLRHPPTYCTVKNERENYFKLLTVKFLNVNANWPPNIFERIIELNGDFLRTRTSLKKIGLKADLGLTDNQKKSFSDQF